MTPTVTTPRASRHRAGVLCAGVLLLAGCATTPAEIQQWAAANNTDTLPRLEDALAAPAAATRQAAVAALVTFPNQAAAKVALMQAMVSQNPIVRGEVGAAVVFNPDADLDLGSISLVGDPDPGVRAQMAAALAAAGRAGPFLNTNRAAIYLWGLTQDSDPGVRAAAVEGAGALGLNDPIDFALNALRKDPEPRVRAAAARGLGTLIKPYLAGAVALPRGEEIAAALMQTADNDKGQYEEVNLRESWLFTRTITETHYVAAEAAQALTVVGITPRPDVAAAIKAGLARVPPPTTAEFHPYRFNFRGNPE